MTNAEETPLTSEASAVIWLGAAFDHLISIGMYSLLGLVGGLIAAAAEGQDLHALAELLSLSFDKSSASIPLWREQIEDSVWLDGKAPPYFLARGSSVASCHEARLLWEEAAKCPATALTTGSFRHGSQAMIRPGVRVALWLQPSVLRPEDFAACQGASLRRCFASVDRCRY